MSHPVDGRPSIAIRLDQEQVPRRAERVHFQLVVGVRVAVRIDEQLEVVVAEDDGVALDQRAPDVGLLQFGGDVEIVVVPEHPRPRAKPRKRDVDCLRCPRTRSVHGAPTHAGSSSLPSTLIGEGRAIGDVAAVARRAAPRDRAAVRCAKTAAPSRHRPRVAISASAAVVPPTAVTGSPHSAGFTRGRSVASLARCRCNSDGEYQLPAPAPAASSQLSALNSQLVAGSWQLELVPHPHGPSSTLPAGSSDPKWSPDGRLDGYGRARFLAPRHYNAR